MSFKAEFGDAARDCLAILLAAERGDWDDIDFIYDHAEPRHLVLVLTGIVLSCFGREGRITGETPAAIIEGMRDLLAPLRGL